MPKKTKTGKQRKDKFYKLAKETGFRSRASFKLIQLNRKFEFLPKCRVLVDLCAAPGGWLQVAKQAMPVSSLIIGVDLVPIKPIPNVITFQEDITTDRCRQALKKQLNTWKVDIFLNDGAPNVGKNWIQDAFSQNQLTLSALKLASEFLVRGGWFITKVFRSKDYLSLVWVFKKLFKYVHVTKPQASRNESAEIFVVCQGYSAPDHIDPKFLDAAHLFKDVQNKSETKSNILAISNKKAKAEGYDDAPIFTTLKASDFIFCENHLERLGKCNEIIFDDDDLRDHKLTTEEIKQCCKDVKVLGKADLKLLLNWRKQISDAVKVVEKSETSDKIEEEDRAEKQEEKEINAALKEAEDLELSKLQEAKRKKKKILKQRKKLHDRMNLKMIIKDDDPVVEEDQELFKLSLMKDKNELNQIEDDHNLEFGLEAPQPDINNILEYRKNYIPYDKNTEDDHRVEAECADKDSEYSSDNNQESELEFESESEEQNETSDLTQTILDGKKNPLMVDLVDRSDRVEDTIDRWFDKEEFKETKNDEDLELDLLAETIEKKKLKNVTKVKDLEKNVEEESDMELEKTNGETTKKENSAEGVKLKSILKSASDNQSESGKKAKKRKKVKLDPEGLALGSLLIQSKKMKRDIIEAGYNRYASNDENLPAWFVDDEKKHYRKELPVTKDMIAEYKLRLREINARSIKKVVEAKARKKRRAQRRMEKAKKRAEKITEHPDMTEKEKVDQLKTIYKKALPKENKDVTYVVAKKGIGRRVHRPTGVKGRFRVVDPRMKKDARKEKMIRKTQKKPQPKKQMKQKQKVRRRK